MRELLASIGFVTRNESYGVYYNPSTGQMYRIKEMKTWTPVIKGGKEYIGHVHNSYGGGTIPVTHIIWHIMTGKFPTCFIDCIDGDPKNTRFDNLRECTREQNSFNTKSRNRNLPLPRGVTLESNGKYSVRVSGIHIGTYDTVDVAEAKAKEVRRYAHKEFAYENRPKDIRRV